MERKSSRMIPLTYLLVISLMALYGTHTLAGDHPYHGDNTTDGHAMDYWWVDANNRLGPQEEAKENGNGTLEPSYARMPYWWENNTIDQSHACRYGWQNTVNSSTALMSYWWHHAPAQDVSLP